MFRQVQLWTQWNLPIHLLSGANWPFRETSPSPTAASCSAPSPREPQRSTDICRARTVYPPFPVSRKWAFLLKIRVKPCWCKYLYLFAADHTEQADIKKLVYYYKSSLKFYECDDDIMLIKPEYDENCYGLVQEIAKLRENREAVWQEYSDISGHY